MSKSTFVFQTIILVLLFSTNGVFAGETSKYTGTVYASPVKNLMPLGNGDAVVIMQSVGIVAMSGEPAVLRSC